MLGFIHRLWDGVARLFALMFPMFVRTAPAGGLGPAGAWAARGLVVAVVLVLLGLLNQSSWLGADRWLHSPLPVLNSVWIPTLILALYLTCWLGWWFWLTLHADRGPVSGFPDIDAAWDRATEALGKAGILLHDVPVFLILGQTADGEEALFQSAGLKPLVNQVPRSPGAPLHVTASRDAVFVTCPGASCLGPLTAPGGDEGESGLGPEPEDAEDKGDELATIGIGQGLKLDVLLSQGAEAARKRAAARRKVIEVEPLKARLAQLCRLIARDRKGFCSINGALVLIPADATGPQGDPEEFARCCKADLATTFDVLGVRCPILALVCDLERLPGFAEILTHLPPGQTSRRMGQRFPLVTDLRPAEVAAMIEGGIEWVGQTLFPNLICSLFRLETPGSEEVKGVALENAALFRFLAEIRARQDRLARILTSCFATASGEPLLFGGCYLGGTGSSPTTGQAFVSGVFKRLIQDQDLVSWTESALKRDAAAHRRARQLGIGLTVVNVLVALVVIYLIYQLFTRQS
jgi:IcmF-related N-terminal domain